LVDFLYQMNRSRQSTRRHRGHGLRWRRTMKQVPWLGRLGFGVTRALRCAAGATAMCAMVAGAAQAASDVGSKSGLPVPGFVSRKPDRVNVRGGPTRDHDVTWVYTRAGLPVEITAESENWRRIRDWEGAEGWVYHSMLSGRRTGVVKTKEKNGLVPLLAKP